MPGLPPRRAPWPTLALSFVLPLLLPFLGACAPTMPVQCDLVRIAEMPLQSANRLLTVPVGINGQWARMLVDTGAERSLLSEAAVKRLGLARDARFVSTTGGVGGAARSADVKIDSLVLGNVRFPVERMTVNRLAPSLPVDGLLGADILLAFDLDIDVPGHKLTVYRVRQCPTADPPWPDKAVPIAGVTAFKDRMMLAFELNGVAGKALLDTGAQTTAIGRSFALRLGLTDEAMSMDRAVDIAGVGAGKMKARLHWFRSLRIGPVAVQGLMLPVLPADLGFGDGLIGQDFLLNRRVWMSFPTRRLFISQHDHERLAPK